MKRWWGIRHIRFFWLSYHVHLHAQRWAQLGIGLGIPNESDFKYLDAVWRGEV